MSSSPRPTCTEQPSRVTRLHALNLAITSLESQYASMLATYISLPPTILTNPSVGVHPEDLDLCRREVTERWSFFRRIPGAGKAIEATKLRAQACRIQSLLVLRRYDNAGDDLTLAEQDIARYRTRLSDVRLALNHLELAAQHHIHSEDAKVLQNTSLEFEDSYAALKARYHALSVSPAALQSSEADLWDLVALDEAFGESLVKDSEVEALISRSKAVAPKVESAVALLRTYEADDLLQEEWTVVNDIARHLAELERLVGEQESKQAMRKWYGGPRPSSTGSRHGDAHNKGDVQAFESSVDLGYGSRSVTAPHELSSPQSLTQSQDAVNLQCSGSSRPLSQANLHEFEAQHDRDEIQTYLALLPPYTPWPEFCSVSQLTDSGHSSKSEQKETKGERGAQQEEGQETGDDESWYTCSEGRSNGSSSVSSGSWVVL